MSRDRAKHTFFLSPPSSTPPWCDCGPKTRLSALVLRYTGFTTKGCRCRRYGQGFTEGGIKVEGAMKRDDANDFGLSAARSEEGSSQG